MKTISLISLLLVFSCIDKKEQIFDNEKISVDLDITGNINLSELATDIEYIWLKTGEQQILARPNKMFFTDNLIFIEENFSEKVFVFDLSGNFLNTIGEEGEGPFQNMTLDDFSVHNDTVWIKDSKLKKLIGFDFEGKPLQEKNLTLTRGPFIRGDNFSLFSTNNNSDIGYRIIRLDNSGQIQGFFDIAPWLEHKLFKGINRFIFDKRLNTFYFLLPYSNELVLFDGNGNFKNLIKLDFGKYNFKPDDWARFDNIQDQINYAIENNLVFSINNYFITKDRIWIYVQPENKEGNYLIFDHQLNLVDQFNSINNDLDGFNFNSIPWSASEDAIYYRFRSQQLMEQFENLNEAAKYQESKISGFVRKNPEVFDDPDNLILIKISLK